MIILICIIVFLIDSTCCNNTYLGEYESKSRLGIYKECAVSTDSTPCAPIGKEILDKNGSAADSIIAVLLCMGVTIPESLGLGGGSIIVFYNSTSNNSDVIIAREKAPIAAYEDMFDSNAILSRLGTLSIAVPGELAGYWQLHQRFGRLAWNQLFSGAIQLSRYGFHIGSHLADAMKQNEVYLKNHPSLREIYVNQETGEIFKEGDKLIQFKLSQTLELLANSKDPIKLFYDGIITDDILNDLNEQSIEWKTKSILTKEDFRKYSVDMDRLSVKTHLNRGNLILHTSPLPSTGLLLAFILKVMEKYDDMYSNSNMTVEESVLFHHRLVEAYKYAFSRRLLLGDDRFEDVTQVVRNITSEQYVTNTFDSIDDFQTYNYSHYGADVYIKDDRGTAHVSVVDRYGNAAAVSTSVNMYFGSKVLSKSTGILLNNQMDDFSSNTTNAFGVPPSQHNLISAQKRPLSSMAPSVVTDERGNIRLVIGGSGGTKITTALAYVCIRHLWLNETIKQAIDYPRIHHQLIPNEIVYENNFPTLVLQGLQQLGHNIRDLGDERGAVVMAISGELNALYANSDYRKGGDVDGS